MAGISLRQLKVVAKEAIKLGDPNGIVTECLCRLAEEQSTRA
jgi:hypothetical protein